MRLVCNIMVKTSKTLLISSTNFIKMYQNTPQLCWGGGGGKWKTHPPGGRGCGEGGTVF